MKDLTARVPPELVEKMDSFIDDSPVYTTRAEFARHAVAEKLARDEEG
jgi:Arc/MetJ-type ribon-helix-helix transcriptional regulator